MSGIEASERIPAITIRGRRDPVELFRLGVKTSRRCHQKVYREGRQFRSWPLNGDSRMEFPLDAAFEYSPGDC